MSPRTREYRGSLAMSARLSGLPAYVSLSKFTISTEYWEGSRCRIKFDPIKPAPPVTRTRSEEHTSELQSPDQIVCRLLLEKKNKNTTLRSASGTSLRTRKLSF